MKTALLLLLACADEPATDKEPLPEPHGQDIVSTNLALDLASTHGVATLEIAPATGSGEVWVAVSGLTLNTVSLDGVTVEAAVADGVLRLPVEGDAAVTLLVDYTFPARAAGYFDGWMPDLGVTFIWPYYCANLFPCDPSMRDGVRFTLSVTGVEEGKTAIYPADTYGVGPAYMPAIAVGEYVELPLGTTTAGTAISAYYRANGLGEGPARQGTAHLVDVVDYYETVYGPYLYGPKMGAVEVDWGTDSAGGMEHHPYYHVGKMAFGAEEAHVHEAAHAWFGDGVRLACWEDFVLSEGTVTYMAARAMEQVGGPDQWSYYVDDYLTPICEGQEVNAIVFPQTCNEIDFVNDDLWSLATYMKGACFYEEVADAIGADALDVVIGEFYGEHATTAAEMDDMMEALYAAADDEGDAAIAAAAEDWLLSYDCPADYAARCRAHQ